VSPPRTAPAPCALRASIWLCRGAASPVLMVTYCGRVGRFAKGSCKTGFKCPMRHQRVKRTDVCKHWLRSQCKKGDQCEYLHQYDMKRMPLCHFFADGQCTKDDCQFLHIRPEDKIVECPWSSHRVLPLCLVLQLSSSAPPPFVHLPCRLPRVHSALDWLCARVTDALLAGSMGTPFYARAFLRRYARGFCKHGPKCRKKHVRKELCGSYMAGFCPKGPGQTPVLALWQ